MLRRLMRRLSVSAPVEPGDRAPEAMALALRAGYYPVTLR